jgi:hypothetical protein
MGIIMALVVALSVFGFFTARAKRTREREQREAITQEAYKAVLERRGEIETARALEAVGRFSPQTRMYLRQLQLMLGYIDSALTSKKEDAAERQIKAARETYRRILSDYGQALADDGLDALRSMIEDAEREFHTVSYLNVAQGYLDKAATLKTDRSKRKYWDLAREKLEEGLEHPFRDGERLNALLKTIPESPIDSAA